MDLWFGTRGPRDAKIMVVGEAWGAEEEARSLPFMGQSGQELSRIFSEAGLVLDDCFLTNLYPGRPRPDNDFKNLLLPGSGPQPFELNPKPELIEGLENLNRQIVLVNPRLIIACGNYPLWALTRVSRIQKGTERPKNGKLPEPHVPTGIGDFHGSQLYTNPRSSLPLVPTPPRPILPIYHPASILRDWSQRATTVHDLRTRVPLALAGAWDEPERNYLAPPNYLQTRGILNGWLDHAHRGNIVELALDIENVPRVLTCIGLGDVNALFGHAIAIPFVRITDTTSGALASYWTASEEANLLLDLSNLFAHPNVSILGQNLVYDYQWLWHTLRLRPRVSWDTLVAQNLLFPGTKKDLGTLSSIYCAHHRYWKDDNHEWTKTGTLEQHLRYNCEDICRTFEIATRQREIIKRLGWEGKWDFERKKINLALEMNMRGMKRDLLALSEAALKIRIQLDDLATKLLRVCPQEFVQTTRVGNKTPTPWYRSDSQTKWVLYELLRIPPELDQKTKRPTTGKDALLVLEEKFPALALLFTWLRDYNSLDTLESTFIKAKGEPFTNRFHSSFNPGGTATLRFSSSGNAFGRGGNFQNIPVGGDE